MKAANLSKDQADTLTSHAHAIRSDWDKCQRIRRKIAEQKDLIQRFGSSEIPMHMSLASADDEVKQLELSRDSLMKKRDELMAQQSKFQEKAQQLQQNVIDLKNKHILVKKQVRHNGGFTVLMFGSNTLVNLLQLEKHNELQAKVQALRSTMKQQQRVVREYREKLPALKRAHQQAIEVAASVRQKCRQTVRAFMTGCVFIKCLSPVAIVSCCGVPVHLYC